jgi:alkylated DNA repair dioxygenase AlkB
MFTDPQIIIKHDGEAIYYPCVFDGTSSVKLLAELVQNINWQHDQVIMFGKQITTKRKVAWYAGDGISYTYAGKTKEPNSWTPLLLSIKEKVEKQTNANYNACLLNLYHAGDEGMSWHRDNEKEIVPESSIASVSFGAARKFAFKHVHNEQKMEIMLEPGSVLDMRGPIQQHWYHALPPSKKVKDLRVNLTFRLLIK